MPWPNRRLTDLLNIELPIVQAPMAGANDAEMAIAVCRAGGLGSLPCALLNSGQIREEVRRFRTSVASDTAGKRPMNLNFFCHSPPKTDPEQETRWLDALAPYYAELNVPPPEKTPPGRQPFDEDLCALVEDVTPEVVSFHFGLPAAALMDRVKCTGARVLSSATTVAEACWLEARGCDAIIAQGAEAGGHRGLFLGDDIASQPGTFALVPQVVDAVSVPVIAAGGVTDGRGIAAAFALGASGVQIGTAYLFSPEARISELHREALGQARDDRTALTNLFSGRPARSLINRLMQEIGPMSADVPPFPTAGAALTPLKARAEAMGSSSFSSLWSGQSARLGQALGAEELTHRLAEAALVQCERLSGPGGTD